MSSIDRELRMAISTGKVHFGSKMALRELLRGRIRMAIISSNCPSETRNRILEYGKLAEVPVVTHPKDSMELGVLCGKPFPISAIVINDPGDSKILSLEKSLNAQ